MVLAAAAPVAVCTPAAAALVAIVTLALRYLQRSRGGSRPTGR
ncbi:MAG: hypothetical protein R3A10_06275 [Caldilineaceae bacterium]